MFELISPPFGLFSFNQLNLIHVTLMPFLVFSFYMINVAEQISNDGEFVPSKHRHHCR